MEKGNTRRDFLQVVMAGSLISVPAGVLAAAQKDSSGGKGGGGKLKLGLASYSLRAFSLEETLKITKKIGLKYIALKSMHLPLDSDADAIKKAVGQVKRSGITLYGAGVVKMNTQADVDQAFAYAKAAGMKTIIGVPLPELLDMVDRKVKEYDIQVAIHNHGPGDKLYPTPAVAIEKIKNLDKRIGVCVDVGHTLRIGVDPIEAIRQAGARVLDVHIKDVNAANAKGKTVEIGRGVIDIPGILKQLLAMKYDGVVAFEYEKDKKSPSLGLAESVGYVRGVLAIL